MTGLMNDYFNEVLNKSLLGITKLHTGLIELESCNAILRKDYRNMLKKVKLISGGKADNELTYTGFVGPGMLTAAIIGNAFCAPSVNNIVKVIEEVESDCPSGVLLIIQNYAEYSINFASAKLSAEAKGYTVKVIIVNNVSYYFESTIMKEQELLPMSFIYKIAGAMSEEGKSINEIYSVCNSIVNSGEIALLKIEHESIVHNYELETLSNLVKQLLKPLISVLNLIPEHEYQNNTHIYQTKTYHVGHEVAIVINNFGCNQIATNIFVLELLKQIDICGLIVRRVYLKSLATSVSGFCICLLNLSFTTALIKYLDFPTYAPAWPKILSSGILDIKDDDTTQLRTSKKYNKSINIHDLNAQGPIISHKIGQSFLSVISTACEALIACTKQLNIMDQQFGNGDCGTNLARGADAIQCAIQKCQILGTNIHVVFIQISEIIERTVGGLQGGLYSLFFHNVAKAFSEYENDKEITIDMWLHALSKANKAIEKLEISSLKDQALVAVLIAMQKELKNALNNKVNPVDAFGAVVHIAEKFAMDTACVQCPHMKIYKESKYPNPQAHAVGIWMRGAYEGIKLRFFYHYTK